MFVKTQKFLIVGISKSGFAVTKYALEKGAQCYIYEELKSAKIDDNISELINLGAKYLSNEDYESALNFIDVVVLSPGVPINHKIAISAKKLGKRIIGELEFGYLQFVPPVIAVTGTNGKTTTVSLIEWIIKQSGNEKVKLVGNVGVPITSVINQTDKDTLCVAEVSSFQLESVNSFCPHVACITNISPDHLERHYTMENYVFLKKRIFKNQRESEFTVLNYDDPIVKSFAEQTKAKVLWVSLKEKVEGAYRSNGKIYLFDEYLMDENQIRLSGDHNVYDSLFAIISAKLVGVDNQSIVNGLMNFKGVRHRVEFVCEKGGVSYYNDSKATNTSSTISAIDMMKNPTILILGGSDKGEDFTYLFEKIKNSLVKQVVLTGKTRLKMLEQACKVGFTDLTVTGDFYNAVKIAELLSVSGDNVLLSPACASFDSFSDYEQRGDEFIKIVKEFKCE